MASGVTDGGEDGGQRSRVVGEREDRRRGEDDWAELRDVGQRRLQEQIFVRLRQARDGDTYAMAAAVGSLLPMVAAGLPSKGNQSVSSLSSSSYRLLLTDSKKGKKLQFSSLRKNGASRFGGFSLPGPIMGLGGEAHLRPKPKERPH